MRECVAIVLSNVGLGNVSVCCNSMHLTVPLGETLRLECNRVRGYHTQDCPVPVSCVLISSSRHSPSYWLRMILVSECSSTISLGFETIKLFIIYYSSMISLINFIYVEKKLQCEYYCTERTFLLKYI